MNGLAAISDLSAGPGAHPSHAYVLGVIAGCLLVLVLGFFLAAFILQVFVRVLFGYWPSFKNALATTFCNMVIALILGGIARIIFGNSPSGIVAIGLPILQLGLQTYIIGAVVEHPSSESGKLGFPKAALLVGVQFVVGICIGLAVFFFVLPAGVKSSLFHARPQRNIPAATASSAPIPPVAPLIGTPPAAKPTTVEAAQREAVRRYPDLGVNGSAFNREFRTRYERYRKSDPKYFLEKDWPLSLADETDAALKAAPIK